ncbi:hypothetical protein FACS1894156_5400 [Bacteroidia bacterium]|nr:hypothetical protein FACS1894156_5400 [Bacteroidia bacterium]
MTNEIVISQAQIENRIFTIRGVQVMLDSDLAEMFQVETRVLNQAVKRNIERFPQAFRFQLIGAEVEDLRSQIATSSFSRYQFGTLNETSRSQYATLNDFKNSKLQIATLNDSKRSKSQFVTLNDSPIKRGQNIKYLPYAFTEQGIAMLSAVLRSETAVNVSIQIMQTFVEMRKFILGNASIFQRLDNIEHKQLETDQKFEQVFKALEATDEIPKQGVFFDGQVFDAYMLATKIIRSAKKSIVLIDNYIDETALALLCKKEANVRLTLFTKNISRQMQLDIDRANQQYPFVAVKTFAQSHDRFLIIDSQEVFHLGASLKDLGKKWFAFSKIDKSSVAIIHQINNLL